MVGKNKLANPKLDSNLNEATVIDESNVAFQVVRWKIQIVTNLLSLLHNDNYYENIKHDMNSPEHLELNFFTGTTNTRKSPLSTDVRPFVNRLYHSFSAFCPCTRLQKPSASFQQFLHNVFRV